MALKYNIDFSTFYLSRKTIAAAPYIKICLTTWKNSFLELDGAFNFNAFGGYPGTLFPGTITRKGFLDRVGYLGNVTPTARRSWNPR